MCRMLGYLGEPIRLAELLERPPHSLEHQSYAAQELRGAVVCADGWGAGFYVPDDPLPCLYRSTLPIWADSNREHLGRAIHSHCALACVRSATDPLSVSIASTPPFSMGPLVLAHNGFIENFAKTLARELEQELSDTHYRQIRGRTDTEYVLAAIADAHQRARESSPPERLLNAVTTALRNLMERTERAGIKGLFALLVSDGESLLATRVAVGDEPPSLYFSTRSPSIRSGVVIASEPLEGSGAWHSLPAQRAYLFSRDGTRDEVALF
jgi:ergothioneine biosynthesis protein EgtC